MSKIRKHVKSQNLHHFYSLEKGFPTRASCLADIHVKTPEANPTGDLWVALSNKDIMDTGQSFVGPSPIYCSLLLNTQVWINTSIQFYMILNAGVLQRNFVVSWSDCGGTVSVGGNFICCACQFEEPVCSSGPRLCCLPSQTLLHVSFFLLSCLPGSFIT